ncbi:lysylphosphatidylglycerol synthase transmembrane domain-containing protein [Candidatus Undinarchaeota archaeon]
MYKKILILFSIILLAGVIYISDPAQIYAEISGANPTFLFWVLLIPPVNFLFRLTRWKLLLDSSAKVKISKLAPVFLAGIALSNLTPARVGEAAKALFLKKSERIRFSTSLGSIIWERLFDLIVLIVFAVPFFGLLLSRLSPNLVLFGQVSIIFVFILILLVVTGMYYEKLGYKMLKFAEKIPILDKFVTEDFVNNFYKNSKQRKSVLLLAFVLTIIIWIVDGIVFYFSFKSIGITEFNYWFFIGIMAFTLLCGVASFLPGGLGSTDAVFVGIMVLYGVSKGQAAAGMLIGRAWMLGFYYLFGLLSLLYLAKTHPKEDFSISK